ncbi:NAD(P)/FAD-dependent oxidoreductase [Chelativorans sp. YIM 93263]|uniref:NAD(P)/FAD-dependent oxidoreductase n=1 Tax=Chelativorans sp. YIM 93263 TaxID=2906648 RepID=UPI0023791B6A|nr:FAD-binding oxidoreductase [Chelativorans sp. YIM 93263]
MNNANDVLVIGAGIVGASIGWHLAASGARVTILDAGAGGGKATPSSFAWINASRGNPEPYFRLRTRSMEEWKRLSAAVPDLSVSWPGGLCWDMTEDELRAYAGNHASWGYDVRLVDRIEAARIEPGLLNPPALAAHAAGEGMADPEPAARALLADAARLGARIVPDTRVITLLDRDGRAPEVITNGGTFSPDALVLAAGAATPQLAASVGVHVPMETPPGLLVHSQPYRRVLNGLVLAPDLHMRQTAQRRLVVGAGFGGTDPKADPASAAREVFERMRCMLRDADDLAFGFYSVGYRPTPEDGVPIVGSVDSQPGLYLAVMHSGITLAPAVGRFLAGEILDGQREALLEPYRLSRFTARQRR